MLRRTIVAVMLCVGAGASAHAQWINHPAQGIPRTKDGKPNLSAPTPRGTGGKPDLSGVWSTDPTPFEEMERLFGDLKPFAVPGDDPRTFTKYFLNIFADFRPEDVPFRPEAAEAFRRHLETTTADQAPTARCFPAGVPMGDLLPLPRRVIHVPGLLAILYEGINPQRLIYTDGRKLLDQPQPVWMGYSVGKWDGDTFVVDTIGINEQTWMDNAGRPHSDALHTVERYRRGAFGTMDVTLTIDDPKAYTRPWTVNDSPSRLVVGQDLLEYVCAENNRDVEHLSGAGRK